MYSRSLSKWICRWWHQLTPLFWAVNKFQKCLTQLVPPHQTKFIWVGMHTDKNSIQSWNNCPNFRKTPDDQMSKAYSVTSSMRIASLAVQQLKKRHRSAAPTKSKMKRLMIFERTPSSPRHNSSWCTRRYLITITRREIICSLRCCRRRVSRWSRSFLFWLIQMIDLRNICSKLKGLLHKIQS